MKIITLAATLILILQNLSAENKLSVSNVSATIYKPANKLTITIGVENFDQSVKNGAQINARKMQAVIENLKAAGLTDEEIQTKDFTIAPQLSPTPKNPPADWLPTITGYQIRHSLEIHTQKLGLAGDLIDAATKEQANIIHSISFSLQNEEQAKNEALGKAYRQAETYANTLAQNAGIQLGNVLEITTGHPSINTHLFKAERFVAETIATPITPHDVEVSASVSVTYGIAGVN